MTTFTNCQTYDFDSSSLTVHDCHQATLVYAYQISTASEKISKYLKQMHINKQIN